MASRNYLNIRTKSVEEAKNEVDYWFQVIRLIRWAFPKGYIEFKALCTKLYGARSMLVCEKLKSAGIDVDEPVLTEWSMEASREFFSKIILSLAFVNRAGGDIHYAILEKALNQVLVYDKPPEK